MAKLSHPENKKSFPKKKEKIRETLVYASLPHINTLLHTHWQTCLRARAKEGNRAGWGDEIIGCTSALHTLLWIHTHTHTQRSCGFKSFGAPLRTDHRTSVRRYGLTLVLFYLSNKFKKTYLNLTGLSTEGWSTCLPWFFSFPSVKVSLDVYFFNFHIQYTAKCLPFVSCNHRSPQPKSCLRYFLWHHYNHSEVTAQIMWRFPLLVILVIISQRYFIIFWAISSSELLNNKGSKVKKHLHYIMEPVILSMIILNIRYNLKPSNCSWSFSDGSHRFLRRQQTESKVKIKYRILRGQKVRNTFIKVKK